jgi:hypothetical protein
MSEVHRRIEIPAGGFLWMGPVLLSLRKFRVPTQLKYGSPFVRRSQRSATTHDADELIIRDP